MQVAVAIDPAGIFAIQFLQEESMGEEGDREIEIERDHRGEHNPMRSILADQSFLSIRPQIPNKFYINMDTVLCGFSYLLASFLATQRELVSNFKQLHLLVLLG